MGNTPYTWHTIPTAPGVLYREHPSRKVHRKADRFLAIRYQHNGKRTVETLGWVSEGWSVEQATQLLGAIKRNIRTGSHPQSLKEMREMDAQARQQAQRDVARRQIEGITFGELALLYQQWALENRVSGASVERILRLHVLPEIGHMRADEITPADIQALHRRIETKRPATGRWKNATGSRLAPQTVLHILKVIREVYNFALETPAPGGAGVMLFTGQNPAKISRRGRGVRPPAKDSRRLRVLNDAEIAAIFTHTKGKPQTETHYHMILLSLDTGLRCGELCHLRFEDIDLANGAIRVLRGSNANRSTKGGLARIVYAGGLFPDTLPMLRARAASGGSPLVFPGKNGGVRDTTAVSRIMSRLAERLGLNDGVENPQNLIVWHSLRHTYATRMLEAGCDIYTLKELMGHASVTTTEGYLHLCDKAKRAAALARQAMHAATSQI